MPPLKLSLRTSTRLRCPYRAASATSRPRKPPPPPRYNARSRSLKGPQSSSRRRVQPSKDSAQEEPGGKLALSDALKGTKTEDNSLLAPVHIPEDPNGVLNEKHPAASILANSGIVVQRQLELMNVMIGFEQANKYVILDPQGNHIGFIAEQDNSMGRAVARQMLTTHRSFTTHIFDKDEKEVLRFHRPFSWISSRIGVYDPVEVATGSHSQSRDMISQAPGSVAAQTNVTSSQISPLSLADMRIIGEAQQQWAPLRRKYNLFLFHQPPNAETDLGTRQIASGEIPLSSSQQLQVSEAASGTSPGNYSQFAYVNELFLSWDFSLLSADGRKIGSVNRNWGGIGRELFTDTGVYALRMDAAGSGTDVATQQRETEGMTLDQRAVMLATAVSIDFDYFSRHSGAGGGVGWMPLWFPWGGGEAAAAGGAAEGAGAVGAAEEGSVIRGVGSAGTNPVGEGAAVGAGSMAGYEAMQRASGRSGGDDATPTFQEEFLEPGDTDQIPEEREGKDGYPEVGGGDWGGGGGVSGGRESRNDAGDWGAGTDGGEMGGGIDVGDFFDF
ncbi:MAG: hypothetical protein Q9223_005993 [Gallowayella weberi]